MNTNNTKRTRRPRINEAAIEASFETHVRSLWADALRDGFGEAVKNRPLEAKLDVTLNSAVTLLIGAKTKALITPKILLSVRARLLAEFSADSQR